MVDGRNFFDQSVKNDIKTYSKFTFENYGKSRR